MSSVRKKLFFFLCLALAVSFFSFLFQPDENVVTTHAASTQQLLLLLHLSFPNKVWGLWSIKTELFDSFAGTHRACLVYTSERPVEKKTKTFSPKSFIVSLFGINGLACSVRCIVWFSFSLKPFFFLFLIFFVG